MDSPRPPPPAMLCLWESLLQWYSDPSSKHTLHRAANGNHMAERGLSPSAVTLLSCAGNPSAFGEAISQRRAGGPLGAGWLGSEGSPGGPAGEGKGEKGRKAPCTRPDASEARPRQEGWGISLRDHPRCFISLRLPPGSGWKVRGEGERLLGKSSETKELLG